MDLPSDLQKIVDALGVPAALLGDPEYSNRTTMRRYYDVVAKHAAGPARIVSSPLIASPSTGGILPYPVIW